MPLAAGIRLGVYEILGPIGAGGMGEVYRARDTRLGRDVAIKVLPADVVSRPDRVARFEREARAVAALNHPNIVTLHEVGASEAGPYLVLERVEGASLGAPKWIAYSSDEVGGQREIWIAPFAAAQPLSEARRPVTRTGGTMPRWSGDGRELYYWSLDGRIMAISFETTPSGFRASDPKELFRVHRPTLRTNDIEFDVTRDGQRFLVVEPAETASAQALTILINWPDIRR